VATTSTPFPLGVFVGNPNTPGSSAEATFDAENEAFDSLMGTTPVFQNTYIDASQTPSEWASNASWFASVSASSPTFAGSIPVIGLPMGSTNPDAPSTEQILENFADGAYDSMLQSMVLSWADAGFKTQYWRPGVEMNLGSTPGYVGSSATLQALWIQAFQHIYTTLHAAASADGVNLKVIWNPGVTNDTTAGNATETLWPGAQYVDVIGADVYADVYPYGAGSSQGIYDWDKSGQELNSPNPVYDTSLQEWASDPVNLEHYYTDPASDQYTLDGSGGSALSLQDLINFAKAQGKPIAIPETGAGATGDGAGLSDNPTFVQWLYSTLANSGVTVDFVSIWDSDGGGTYAFSNSGDDKPEEAAAWAKYFGAQTSVMPMPHAASPADTQVNGTAGAIYDTSGNAWTINSGQQIEENGTVVASSAQVVTLFWTGTALDQLNSKGVWWTQPLDGSAGTELSAAPAGYAPPPTGIAITPATEAVATTDTASTKPFRTIVIADANAAQTETATVSLSAAANGTLSDPNAATDGSKISNGVLTVSGSAAAVATDLDGLVFTPTPNQVAAGAAVTTTVTAAVKDTAGETASATSTVTATQVASSPPPIDTLALQVSEDHADGDAEFTVSVNGVQVGGDYQAHALHASGDAQTVTLTGNWGSGVNDVEVSFINHVYGRNLYVSSISENGTSYAGTSAAFPVNESHSFAVGGATPTEAAPADTLTLSLSEDAWEGDAEFVLYIDGKTITTPQLVTALHDANATQGFSFTGNFGAGTHTIGIAFLNDAYGGSAGEDRNLYIDGITLNGSAVFSGVKAEDSNGVATFAVTTTH
jgi:hypothetical protein